MTDLIIHVGPAKCGSTSIQDFFLNHKNPCIQKVIFRIVDERKISALNRAEPTMSAQEYIIRIFKKKAGKCDVLILSNEFLFQCPHAIKSISGIAFDFVSRICIVGYSRRQSDFLISAYSQWLFRIPHKVKEALAVLDELNLDPFLFTGLERQLIEYVVNDFKNAESVFNYDIYNWYKSYQTISDLINHPDATIKCGILPRKGFDVSLIEDFCRKSNLELHKKAEKKGDKIANVRFNDDLIEAVNAALAFGIEMPGPHECNDEIERISAKMNTDRTKDSKFLSKLKAYIDACFSESNQKLCRTFSLREDYFRPNERVDKPGILDAIHHEAEHRSTNRSSVTNRYRKLSGIMAKTCFNLVRS